MENRYSSNFIKMILLYLFVVVSGIVIITYINDYYIEKSGRELILENVTKKSKERTLVFNDFLENIKLQSISASLHSSIKQFDLDGTGKDAVKEEFRTFILSCKLMSKVQMINEDGDEIIRVKRITGNTIHEATDKELQKGIYKHLYVAGTQFHDIESNDDITADEYKFKTIKITKKLENNVVILTYYADTILNRIVNAPLYNVYVVNNSGDIIWNPYNYSKQSNLYETNIQTLYPDIYDNLDKVVYRNNSEIYISPIYDNNLPSGFNFIFKVNPVYMDRLNDYSNKQAWIIYSLVLVLSVIPLLYIKYHHDTIFNLNKLRKLYHNLEMANKKIIEHSYNDELTGAYNRKKYNEDVETLMYDFNRYNDIFTLCVIDIDLFKKINDTYGHIVGDEVLKEFTKFMKTHIRVSDAFYRIGGEEFVLILKLTKKSQAVKTVDTLREKINNYIFTDGIRLSISVGIETPSRSDTVDTLFTKADKHLYKSKSSGRNQITYN